MPRTAQSQDNLRREQQCAEPELAIASQPQWPRVGAAGYRDRAEQRAQRQNVGKRPAGRVAAQQGKQVKRA